MDSLQGKISVIIPVYNRIAFLEEALQSVANQFYNDIEVILVNDGSKRSISDQLISYCGTYPFLQVLELEIHMGVSKARNEGIKQATGSFIHFLDDDDKVAPELFTRAIQELESGGSDVVISNAEVFANDKHSSFYKKRKKNFNRILNRFGKEPVDHWSFFLVYCPPIHSMVFRKKVFDKVNFNEDLSYGEDRYLWLELVSSGVKFKKVDYLGAYYRLDSNTQLESKGMGQIRLFESLLANNLLTTGRAKNYAYAFLCLLYFRKGALLKSISSKLKAIGRPSWFISDLIYLFKFR